MDACSVHAIELFIMLIVIAITEIIFHICNLIIKYLQELAKAAAVNPAHFRCDKTSPTATAIWSNTKPQVALAHIFCGQIKKQNERKGGRIPLSSK